MLTKKTSIQYTDQSMIEIISKLKLFALSSEVNLEHVVQSSTIKVITLLDEVIVFIIQLGVVLVSILTRRAHYLKLSKFLAASINRNFSQTHTHRIMRFGVLLFCPINI